MWRVDCVFTDDGETRQEGVQISAVGQEGVILEIPVEQLDMYRGMLINADVTIHGVRKKKGEADIPRRPYTKHTGRAISTYTLMHADTVVLKAYAKENRVEILSASHIPFALRGSALTYATFYQWMYARINHLSRTYMNVVYIARQVGRDFNEILRDSCAISVIDNFWIKRSDVDTTWEKLNKKRDLNKWLAQTALTGKITEEAFKRAADDTTSLFTIGGAFQKALLNECLLKKDNNAENEAAASLLGDFLGVTVAKASMGKKDNVVRCKLFTSERVSMAHAGDFAQLIGIDKANVKLPDVIHKEMYSYFKKQGRQDIVSQLERLYIFQYLVENMDFHEENFGILYDSSTFEILKVAPAYDFNSALEGWCIATSSYNAWLGANMKLFMSHHPDLKHRMQQPEFTSFVRSLPLSRKEQFDTILIRADYLCQLV